MKKFIMISPILLSLGVSSAVYGQAQGHDKIAKQINIMTDILKSSLSAGSEQQGYKVTRIDSTYLAGQGALFTVQSHSRGHTKYFGDFGEHKIELPPMPPLPELSGLKELTDVPDIEFVVESSYQEAMQEYQVALESLGNGRHAYRELQEQQRDIAYEIRDIDREIRDLEYQTKRLSKNKEEAQSLKQELKQAQARRQVMKKSLDKANKALNKARQDQKKAKIKQEQARAGYYQGLTLSLAETFCAYGNGLRAIPNDQHISVIVKNAGAKKRSGYQDQIIVFNKKDINQCSLDKITSEKLVEKSRQYSF